MPVAKDGFAVYRPREFVWEHLVDANGAWR